MEEELKFEIDMKNIKNIPKIIMDQLLNEIIELIKEREEFIGLIEPLFEECRIDKISSHINCIATFKLNFDNEHQSDISNEMWEIREYVKECIGDSGSKHLGQIEGNNYILRLNNYDLLEIEGVKLQKQ